MTQKSLLHAVAAQIANVGLDSTEADELWNRLGSLSGRLAAQIHD